MTTSPTQQWSEITPRALLLGNGIVNYTLGLCCKNSVKIENGKYMSDFCDKCQKKTFASKFTGHSFKYPELFFDLKKQSIDADESLWKNVAPWVVTCRGDMVSVILQPCCYKSISVMDGKLFYDMCKSCQQQTVFTKYKKATPPSIVNN